MMRPRFFSNEIPRSFGHIMRPLVAGLGVVVDGTLVAGGVLLPPVDAFDEAMGDIGAGSTAQTVRAS